MNPRLKLRFGNKADHFKLKMKTAKVAWATARDTVQISAAMF